MADDTLGMAIHHSLSFVGCSFLTVLSMVGCNSPRTTERLKDEVISHTARAEFSPAKIKLNDLYGSWLAGEPAIWSDRGEPLESAARLKEKHEIVWQLERGSVAIAAGEWHYADHHFNGAYQALVAARAQRVGDLLSEALANEIAGTYRGQRHEDVYADYYRVMSALSQAMIADGRWRLPQPPVFTEAVAVGATASQQGVTTSQPSPNDHSAKPSAASPLSSINPLDAYDRAINYARGMVNSTLKWVADSNADTIRMNLRYRDDGFARTLAAAVALSHPQPQNSDHQFAVASCEAALRAYAQQRATFAGQDLFHFELGKAEAITRALLLRALQLYDPQRARDLAEKFPELVSDPQQGSVLVIHEAGARCTQTYFGCQSR